MYDAEAAARDVVFQPETESLCTALGISPDRSMLAVSLYQANDILLVIWNVEKVFVLKK